MARIIFVGESELQISDEDAKRVCDVIKLSVFFPSDISKFIRLSDGVIVNINHILFIDGINLETEGDENEYEKNIT